MAFEIKQTVSELENEKLSLTSKILGPGRVVRMAERLRETNQQIPELNFCAISGEEMIGGIAYWPIQIGATPALLLGPLVVNPEWQGMGVGRGLIATTLGIAEMLGHGLVLLVGDLSYYGQSGFVIAPSGLKCPGPVDESRLLIYEIKPGIAADLSGSVSVAG